MARYFILMRDSDVIDTFCYVMLLTSDNDRYKYTRSKMLPRNILTRLGSTGSHRIYEICD